MISFNKRILALVIFAGFCALSLLLNLTGLLEKSKPITLVVWMIAVNICFAVAIIGDKILYGKYILAYQGLKSCGILYLLYRYGCDLDISGYLVADASRFASSARANYHGANIYDTPMPGLCAKLYYITSENSLLIVFLNVSLVTIAAMEFSSILEILNIHPGIWRFISMLIVTLNPYCVLVSFNYLREPLQYTFLLIALKYFIKWQRSNHIIDILLSLIWTALPAYLHGGFISYTIVFALIFVFFARTDNKTEKIRKTIVLLIFAISAFGVIVYLKENIFGTGFDPLGIMKYYNYWAHSLGGGSSYVARQYIRTYADVPRVIAYMVLQFIISPTPMYWRGMSDIAVFFSDSMIAIIAIVGGGAYMILQQRSEKGYEWKHIAAALSVILITALIFSPATFNAGSAIRHRNILMPLYALIIVIIMDSFKKPADERADGQQ